MSLASRISEALKGRCEVDLAAAEDRGHIMTKESWRSREVEALETKFGHAWSESSFERWFHGDNNGTEVGPPQPDSIDELIQFYGASFRNEIFPCDDEPSTLSADLIEAADNAIESISAIRRLAKRGGGG